MVLRDANYQEVTSQSATSDEYGRFNLSFKLPDGGLTGTFRLETEGGSVAIGVEEYKRPKFEVEIDGPEYVIGGEVTEFVGTAKLYAGPAVNDAQVNYRVFVEEQRWFYYYRPGGGDDRQLVDFGELTTDAQGAFTITFTPNVDLAKTRKRYRYVIEVDVADDTGETRTTEATTALRGEKPVVVLSVADSYVVGDSLTIRASGSDDPYLHYLPDQQSRKAGRGAGKSQVGLPQAADTGPRRVPTLISQLALYGSPAIS